MNSDIIEGKWDQVKGEVEKQWGKLTGDTLNQINGSRKKLVGSLQESYGYARDEAEKQLKVWEDKRTTH